MRHPSPSSHRPSRSPSRGGRLGRLGRHRPAGPPALAGTSLLLATLLLLPSAEAGIPDPDPVPGQRVGADSRVNSTLPGAQQRQAVAFAPDGGFVVVWDDSGIHGRRFDRSGTPLGDDFEVAGSGIRPVVGWTDEGFVVVSDSAVEVNVARFTADGTPLGGGPVNVYTTGNQNQAEIARLADGTFVVAWQSQSSPHDSDDYSIRARALSSDGVPFGDEVAINTYTTGRQDRPVVAASDTGGFLVVWQSGTSDVRSRRFAALTGASGADLLLAQSASSNRSPAVAATRDGGYWTTWHDSSGGSGIRLQRLDSAGDAFGLVENLGGPSTGASSVASGRSGDGLAVWTATNAIRARRISSDGSPVGEVFRVDVLGTHADRRGPRVAADDRGGFLALWNDFDCCAGLVASPQGTPAGDVWRKRYPAAAGDLSAGLVAYWPFDDGAAEDDFGAVEDDGDLVGPTSRTGRFGDGLFFNAVGAPLQQGFPEPGVDWVSLPLSDDLELTGDAATVAGWLRLQDFPSFFAEERASVWDGVIDNYVLFLDRDDASIRFLITNTAGTSASARIPQAMLELRRWHHVAGVYDGGAGEVRIYLDGALVDTAPLSGAIRSSLPQLPAIGRNGSGNTVNDDRHYFRGDLDDLAIWDRALAGAEIDALAHHRIFADGFELGSAALWSSSSD